MKRRFTITLFCILSVPLFSFVAASCDRSDDVPIKKTKSDSQETDRLFQEAEVLRVQPSADPVEIILKDMDGRERKLSEFRGSIIFLNFWATWCVPCRREMPSMERLYQRFKENDFIMIGINIEEPVQFVKEFFEDHKLSFISLLDSTGEVRERFRIRAIPSTFILDKTGRIIGKAFGEKEWDRKEVIDLFTYLVNT